jgi:hypothetical protein
LVFANAIIVIMILPRKMEKHFSAYVHSVHREGVLLATNFTKRVHGVRARCTARPFPLSPGFAAPTKPCSPRVARRWTPPGQRASESLKITLLLTGQGHPLTLTRTRMTLPNSTRHSCRRGSSVGHLLCQLWTCQSCTKMAGSGVPGRSDNMISA